MNVSGRAEIGAPDHEGDRHMADVPVQVMVAAFQDVNGASNALNQLKDQAKKGVIHIQDAAVITKDTEGKLHIKETADMGGGKGAVVGGIIGGVIGIIAGPPGVVVGAGVGAAVGGLTAKFVDAGIPDQRLRELGEGLKPNTSAIVAIVEQIWVAEAERQLQEQGAKTVTAALSADIAKQLAEGKDVAYSAVNTGEAVGVTRVAAGGDEAQVSNAVATQDGMYLDDMTKKGDDVKFAAAVITQEGALAVQGAGKVTPAEAKPAAVEAPKAEAAATAPAAEAAPTAESKPADASAAPTAESKPAEPPAQSAT